MLAFLALQGPQPRDELAQWAWPSSTRDKALNSLRQRLFQLRQRVGVEVVTGQRQMALAGGITHDAEALCSAAVALRPATDKPDAANAVLVSGEFLQGCSFAREAGVEAWVHDVRERWRTLRHESWLARAEHDHARSDLDGARDSAARAVGLDPSNERAHALLIRLHYLAGDIGAARDAWRCCVEALKRELDAEPSTATRALASLLQHENTPRVAAADHDLPVAVLRPPQLVGRAAELRQLLAAGRPSALIALVGEAGIGKSRLLQALAQQAELPAAATHAVRMGSAGAALGALGLLLPRWALAAGCALADMPLELRGPLARLEPDSGPLTATPPVIAAWAGALRRVAEWLHTRGLRGIVIDDLQFADEATQDLLLDAWTLPQDEQAPGTLPYLVLGMRPLGLSERWARMLAERGADIAQVLPLKPLSVHAVETLVADLRQAGVRCERDARELRALTGGVPLLLLERVRADLLGLDEPDGGTDELLLRRIEQLDSSARRLLRVLALSGHEMDARLAAQVLGCHPLDLVDAWRTLERAQMVEGGRITSDSLTEAVRAGVPAPIAAALAEAIAEVLAARGVDPAVVAGHWERGARWPEAAAAHEAAARLACQRACRLEELTSLQAAQAAWQRAGRPDEAFRCALASVAAATTIYSAERVDQLLDELAAEAHDESRALDVLLARARHRVSKADLQGAQEPAQAALSLARALADGPRQVAAAGWLGLAWCSRGGEDTARGQALLKAHDDAARGAPAQVELDFFGAVGQAMYYCSDYVAAQAAFQRALDLADAGQDATEVMVNATNRMVVDGVLGQREQALRAADVTLAAWRRLGQPTGTDAVSCCQQVATIYLSEGRYRDALPLLQWCRARFIEGQALVLAAMTELRLARLYLRLGQPQKARQSLAALPPAAPAGTVLARAVVDSRIDTMLRSQPRQSIFDTLAQVFAHSKEKNVIPGDVLSARLRLSVLAANADEALAWAEPALSQARDTQDRPSTLSALIRVAEPLSRLGRHAQAVAHCREALELVRGAPPLDAESVEVWWLAHRILAAAGEHDESLRALQNARRWVEKGRTQVPEEFVDGFLNRNPLHRDVMAAASRLGLHLIDDASPP